MCVCTRGTSQAAEAVDDAEARVSALESAHAGEVQQLERKHMHEVRQLKTQQHEAADAAEERLVAATNELKQSLREVKAEAARARDEAETKHQKEITNLTKKVLPFPKRYFAL